MHHIAGKGIHLHSCFMLMARSGYVSCARDCTHVHVHVHVLSCMQLIHIQPFAVQPVCAVWHLYRVLARGRIAVWYVAMKGLGLLVS